MLMPYRVYVHDLQDRKERGEKYKEVTHCNNIFANERTVSGLEASEVSDIIDTLQMYVRAVEHLIGPAFVLAAAAASEDDCDLEALQHLAIAKILKKSADELIAEGLIAEPSWMKKETGSAS